MECHLRIIKRATDLGAVAYTSNTYGHPSHILRQQRQYAELERIALNINQLAEFAEN